MSTIAGIHPPFTRYRSSIGTRLHLSHLLPYLPQFRTWPALVDAIHLTQALVRGHDYQSMGLGSPGPFELMIHGGHHYASLHTLWQGRPFHEWTQDQARALLSLIGNNGCGPESADDLYREFLETSAMAQLHQRPVSLCYASLAELIIQPSGLWHLVSRHHTTFELLTNEDN